MPDNRTPHWLVQLRFLLLCSPVGIVLAIIRAPWVIPVLLAFFGTLFLFWQGSRLFTNGFVRFCDPEGYRAMREQSCDPFYNSIGAPLNSDSEQIRIFGHEPNVVICPGCGQPVFIQANISFQCPNCDAYWHENQWWRWTGSEWILV